MNIEQIRKLAKIANENNVESIEVQCDDMVVKIKMAVNSVSPDMYAQNQGLLRTYETAVYPNTAAAVYPPMAVSASAGATAAASASAAEAAHPLGHEIKSPMVGVYYSAPSPDKEPFVQVGSHVKKGDTLCIIEAMKLMNEITADKDGEIVKICAENGQVVEYAQALFQIA